MERDKTALIVLENHFYLDSDKNVWCDRVVDYNYLKRYLSVFDKIVVTGRTKLIEHISEQKLLVSGNNVIFVPMPDFKGAKGLILNYFKIKKIVKNQIKKCDCAIYRAPTHLSLFTYKEVLKQNKPLALEFMMAANKMFDGNGSIKKILNCIIDNKAKKMCLNANGVSYVTERILQKQYPCKAIVDSQDGKYFTEFYSSIDLSKDMYYDPKWELNDKPKTINIIHTGYMDSYRKGQDVLIKAVKIVIDKGYNVRLTLIGDGEKRKEFENLVKELEIEKYVFFAGLIKEKEKILKILRESHFFVFPTQSEGLPRTIIEAMSQGLVCISSPVDGIPELLEDEFLIDYNNVEGYSNKIINLINDWEKCCIISQINFKKSQKYEKKIIQSRRDKFYRMLKEETLNNEN